MDHWNLKGKNLVGIGTDGANVMCGRNHSLVTLLKRTWPHLIPVKCICHSLDLIAKKAVKASLPSHVDYLIRESFNWFSRSGPRLDAYQEIAQLIGYSKVVAGDIDGNEEEIDGDTEDASEDLLSHGVPPRLISPSDTRWLVMADCIEKLIGQFEALKTHFQVAYLKEKCFEAKTLHDMYSDPQNYLYLLFLLPILKELKRLNKMFQSNTADPLRVFADLEASFVSFGRRILKPAILSSNNVEQLTQLNLETEFCLLEPDSVDLGSSFLKALASSSLTESQKADLKIRGRNFLKEVFVGFQV